MLTDFEEHLQPILDEPASDLHRLVFADWLEERDPARAEFIRVQVALAETPMCRYAGNHTDLSRPCCKMCAKNATLKARERELLTWKWLPSLPNVAGVNDGQRVGMRHVVDGWSAWFDFSRGFISSVTMPRSALPHLGSILAANPLERISVEGMEFRIGRYVGAITYPWQASSSNAGFSSWPTRRAMCEQLGEWIASVLPRQRGTSSDSDPVRYVVHPGYVRSQSDGQQHYISYPRLIELYRVPADQCVNADRVMITGNPDIHLWPQEDGDYRLPAERAANPLAEAR